MPKQAPSRTKSVKSIAPSAARCSSPGRCISTPHTGFTTRRRARPGTRSSTAWHQPSLARPQLRARGHPQGRARPGHRLHHRPRRAEADPAPRGRGQVRPAATSTTRFPSSAASSPPPRTSSSRSGGRSPRASRRPPRCTASGSTRPRATTPSISAPELFRRLRHRRPNQKRPTPP